MSRHSSAANQDPSDRHAIRLRGPWWRSPGTRFDDQRAMRVQWAADVDAPESDAFVMRRTFNRPTGLDATNRVHLLAAGLDHLGAIELNGQRVWSLDPAVTSAVIDVEISSVLQAVNQLELMFTLPRPALPRPALARPALARVSGEVRLEIATLP